MSTQPKRVAYPVIHRDSNAKTEGAEPRDALHMMKGFLKGGMRSVVRVGQTTSALAWAGLRYTRDRPPTPQLVRETFERLGATYIKLGQFIASSPSIFPREYVEEFQQCLDQTAPVPFRDIEAVLLVEFKRPLSELFAFIDPKPLASASIAQVHAAKLTTGEDVVIKVQKAGVEEVLHTDLGVIHAASRLLEFAMPHIKFAELSGIIEEIKTRMLKEVDFVEEADNIAEFQKFLEFTQNKEVVAPKVYAHASTRRVLTMQRFYGVSMTDLEAMRQYTQDPAQTLITAMNTWFASLMLSKNFHADLHAGNLMLLTDGRIGFIDFGIVGYLKPEVWQASIAFMEAMQAQDYQAMANAMIKMGMTHQQYKTVDIKVLAQDLEKLFGGLMNADPQQLLSGNMAEMNGVMLDMVGIGGRHGIHFPRDFALLMKQMLYFDRFMRILTPQMDIFADERLKLINPIEPASQLLH